MAIIEIKITDRFYEFGNLVFNVQSVNYCNSSELQYENNDDIIVNKPFYRAEAWFSRLISTVLLLFGKVANMFDRGINMSMELIKNFTSNKTNMIKTDDINKANTVIKNNVRNRLLHTINQDIIVEKKEIKLSKTTKKSRLKNQFIDINENNSVGAKEYTDDSKVFHAYLIEVRNKLMKSIFK